MAGSDRSLPYGAEEDSSICEGRWSGHLKESIDSSICEGRWSGHLKESIDEEDEEDRAGN